MNTSDRELTTAEKITVCKANIEIAKSYAEYYESMELTQSAETWRKAQKRLEAQLSQLMTQLKEED
jgi:uncharacterized protein involved in exopolysaccharide biosynthesis